MLMLNERWLVLATVLLIGLMFWLAWRNIDKAVKNRQRDNHPPTILNPPPPPPNPDPASREWSEKVIEYERHITERRFEDWN